MKENDMGRACGTYSTEDKGIQSPCRKCLKERVHLENIN